MPISWNEIRDRAHRFAHDWADGVSEDADAKTFYDRFFDVFGIDRRRANAAFEHRVHKGDGKSGYIDLLWKGILLVEHKSRGKDLSRAYQQAKDYFPGIKDRDLPRHILVSDFDKFHLYNLDDQTQEEFSLRDFPKHIKSFGFMAGYQTAKFKEEDPANIEAAELMGALHDKLKAIGYEGHKLEVYLVRLLFCMFAEDSGVFERRQFQDFIEQRTSEDGSDLAARLAELFEILNTPKNERLKNLDEQLAAFEYVNGRLFEERLPTAGFDREMRESMLECCGLDWSRISPAIFGAMFQSIMDKKLRRNLGAHYTSEKNIMKLIGPLFLDELREEFESIKTSVKKLDEFHRKIASLKFLDPACGCGNFLIIAYRELRLLELDILKILLPKKYGDQLKLDISSEILCNVDQFYGIEIEEFPAQIAQTALWLMDHQMNMRISDAFGKYFARLPLEKSATIVHKNALQIDWRDVIKPSELNHILGNPPFVGKKEQKPEQKADMDMVFKSIKGAGVLDFVTAWYIKAAHYMAENKAIKTAFVSTNSITQGEQVGILWNELIKLGVKIHFAHRTFQWSNEASGMAAVHCVIIGFGLNEIQRKRIFDYASPKAGPQEIVANNINPYLVDAETVLIQKRSTPLSNVPEINKGSEATDFGHLVLTPEEKEELLKIEPEATAYIRKFIGGEEFINDIDRYCLWLVDIAPEKLKSMPQILERVKKVKEVRLASDKARTKEWADYPHLFSENRQPKTKYLAVPKVSSERRTYIPIGFLPPAVIASGSVQVLPNANLFHFGVLSSAMHMAWMRSVCGRMKSDYQYSNSIVYNNFPWPEDISAAHKQAIEKTAQGVLDARENHKGASLATLYDPLTTPPDLVKAHRALDAAVDAAYSKKKFKGDSDRVAFLFDLYRKLSAPLDLAAPAKAKTARARKRAFNN